MNILPPYNYIYKANKYSFETDNSVVYSVEFTDGSFYFIDLPSDVFVFELNIKVLNVGNSFVQPYDKRTEATIVEILKKFLDDNKNCLIYVCNNLDSREHARYRKFDIWFNKNKTPLLEKHDVNFTMQNIHIIASLILHVENSHRNTLVKLFYDLYR
jgi:hypothetical protein